MSNTKYIEIDSTYRNRNDWPLPGQFEVLISQSGRKGRLRASDPVSSSANIKLWTSQNFNTNTNNLNITVTVDTVTLTDPLPSTSNNQTFIVHANSPDTLQQEDDYYINAIAGDNTIGPPIEKQRIISYKYLGLNSSGNDKAQITVQSAFSSAFAAGDSIDITDPTDIVSDTSNPQIFVPNGRNGANSYPQCIMYNETLSIANGVPEYRIIQNYDVITHLASLDTSGSAVATPSSGPVTTWLNTHTYSIRKNLPQIGILNNNVADPSLSVFSLPTLFLGENDAYRNSYIRMTSGGAIGDVRRIVRYLGLSGNTVGGSLTTALLPSTASNNTSYYNGAYIQMLSGAAAGDVRQILDYTVTGTSPNIVRTATVNTAFSGSVVSGDSFAIRSGFVDQNFSNTVVSGDTFEILQFSYDNHNPFVYTGSLVSQQQMVCYEIELVDLILPNKTLNIGVGSRIAFYPYVYVELSNVSGANAGMVNTIYSNNPNATRMTFRAPVKDVPNPVISSFVKLDGNGMVQTLKFKPNDNLMFSVHLPDGSLYEVQDDENVGPLAPNPEIQISALFSIKRL